MDPTLIAPLGRRHHFGALSAKTPRLRSPLGPSLRHNLPPTTSSTGKRAHSDENSDPSSASHKRSKSILSPADLKLSITVSQQPAAKKRAFGALMDVTNVRPSSTPPKAQTRAILKPASPKGRLGSGRGVKRAMSPKRSIRAITPPRDIRPKESSIDALLSSTRAASPPMIVPNAKDSWMFEIYEDTPEEALQNLMEHGTNILDISDDSDCAISPAASELAERGKENIHPDRLMELMGVAEEERAEVMNVDAPKREIRRERRGKEEGKEGREALREMVGEELEAVVEEGKVEEAKRDKAAMPPPPIPAPAAAVVGGEE